MKRALLLWMALLLVGLGGCATGEISDDVSAECGDGTTQSTAGEECDDGNRTSGDGCSSDCKNESGVEICDNAADDDGDGAADCLDADCNTNPACQDSVEDICDNGADDDRDQAVDCADSDCDGRACGPTGQVCTKGQCTCFTGEVTEVDCHNFQDDDCDGDMDCFDSDCANEASCLQTETSCIDGADNDGDGDTDCQDSDCNGQSCGPHGLTCSNQSCLCPTGTEESSCTDLKDNDCDGDTDCFDSECQSEAICQGTENNCRDTEDNDGDGAPDCMDVDCEGQVCNDDDYICASGSCRCPGGDTESICNDGDDNDCDGFVDCNDSDCSNFEGCRETNCANGVDDDNDMHVDCSDSDCAGQSCGDFGRLCAAGACACPGGESFEVSCNDFNDNDCDGATDCNDSDCAMTPACNPTGDCESQGLILCGNAITDSNTAGAGAEVHNYSCTGADEGGEEAIFTFVSTTDSEVTVNLSNATGDVDLLVMTERGNGEPDCNPSDCDYVSAGPTGAESVSFTAEAGGFYYLAVDGAAGVTSPFDIDVSCSGGTACSAGWVLDCGDTDTWSTAGAGATNNVTNYGSCTSLSESGPEFTYIFFPSEAGLGGVSGLADITVNPHNNKDLDVFVLPGNGAVCDGSTCIADNTSVTNPIEITDLSVSANNIYFIVIDGYGETTQDEFDISINCH